MSILQRPRVAGHRSPAPARSAPARPSPPIPQDGLLDAVAIEATSRLSLLRRAYGLRAGRVESQRGVASGRGRRRGRSRPPAGTPFNVDGELVDAGGGDFDASSRAPFAPRRRMTSREPPWRRCRAAARCGEAPLSGCPLAAYACPAATRVRAARHRCRGRSATPTRPYCGCMRTRGHGERPRAAMKALGVAGEWGAVWAAIGLAARRRSTPAAPALARSGRASPRPRSASTSRQARGRPPAPDPRRALRRSRAPRRSSRSPRPTRPRRSPRPPRWAASRPAAGRPLYASPRRSASAAPTSGCTTPPTCSPERRSGSRWGASRRDWTLDRPTSGSIDLDTAVADPP